MFDLYPLARPVLHRLDPETAHELTLRALETGLVPGQPVDDDPVLHTTLFGRRLTNPIGLAAGFDKNARVFGRMGAQGFGFVEIGGVTPRPQAGNPRPRVFRLPADGAVINRMGFPNEGLAVVLGRMRTTVADVPVGVNIASNADSADPAADFVTLARAFAPFAAYLTLDISCPNTANGQVFLDPARLRDLLAHLHAADLGRVPLVAKLSPDIDDARLREILDVLVDASIDGLVVSNSTLARDPALTEAAKSERGGLTGRPLMLPSTQLLARVRDLTGGTIPLIGVGGIASGADAYAKIRAGASAVQLYTAMIYGGPALVTQIKRELAHLLRENGYASIAEVSQKH